MQHNIKQITSREDIELLVRTFYSQVLIDDTLAPKFSHINMEEHFPTMFNFWASMLLHDQSYQGNPFAKHLSLDLQPEHFTRWLEIFTKTVNDLFEGEIAEDAKTRANNIAGIFQHKLGLI